MIETGQNWHKKFKLECYLCFIVFIINNNVYNNFLIFSLTFFLLIQQT